jgi:biopolymer transport protein ExbB/TolQ
MFRQFMMLGGPIMWPLLACSVLLVAVLVERLLSVGVRHRLFRRRLTARQKLWHQRVLPFFTDVPPSLGLLGTVVGVVQSLHVINGRLDSEAVGAGLAVACMTTIYGLSIAIVASASRYLLDWAVDAESVRQELRPR